MIHSFGRDFAPFGAVADEFRKELSRLNPRPVEFLEASLEMARFDGEEREGPLVEFLSSVFAQRRPDLVAPAGAPAALFCQRNRERLFPLAPVLVMGADRRRIPGLEGDSLMTSAHFELDLPALAKDITRLLPGTRRIYMVLGTSPVEQFWEAELKREWTPLLPGVELRWMSALSLAEIKEAVAGAPPQSAVFHAIMSRDAAGAPHSNEDALKEVRSVTSAPVFGYNQEQLGEGIVGGGLIGLRKCGREAAAVGIRLLAGEPPGSIEAQALKPEPPAFDWRELHRWGIPESRLPAGSTVLHRPASLWQTHRAAVLATLAVIIVQSALIMLLLAARRRARESEAGLRLTTEAASIGLWDREIGGDTIRATPEWRALFGLPEGGAIKAEDALQRVHPDDLPIVRQSIEEAMKEGRGYHLEHRVVLPDGTVRWVASRGRAEPAANGQRPRTRGVSLDITERKRGEAEVARQREELAHLSRVASLGELSGALAHELNQPLGSILSNAQAALRLLGREQADIAEVREILTDIVSEDRRAGDVIKRLRALLKRGETQMQPLHIHECIEDVLELVHAELIARGVAVARNFAGSLPQIEADRVQMQQVFLNLVANACDAMDGKPPGERALTLSTRLEDGMVHIEVRDSGTGFHGPAERLFEPFHTTKSKGLGMGLAICRTIVDAHHGRLWAEPCQHGGAVFHLVLPAAPAA